MMRKGTPYIGRLFTGLMRPKNQVPGTGFSGEIEAVGKNVKSYKAGDLVFGESVAGFGAYGEYLCLPEEGVFAIKPDNMTHQEAAPVCDGALTSLNFLKDVANIQAGQRVLIIGASGGLGTAAVQLAKHFRAKVTGVCSTANLDLVKSLGADEVIDYIKEDFARIGKTYDIIYDTVGKSSFSHCKDSLTEKGVYVSPVLGFPLLLQMLWTSMIGSKKAQFSATGIRPVRELRILLNEIKELIKAEKIRSVIDRSYPLEEIQEGHRYVDKGHKIGNVVLIVR
jgi:NADPH:quinone reductase-like Zn-dependent oxidoreductase